ncbi:chromate transporter [Isachenkonia alkalipeptolytica]|uniref:Chromate transporter n=1 Tax=Isachenkonia alkalipeptolytica TaxID=2565777 RepID=A0AA43XIE9_9CLOT|nr:chromate transporter [Isachenkonia alkalipeptolytica]NBG87430.1 chromate transporter [Isachenkonia alkalipeptolytica]
MSKERLKLFYTFFRVGAFTFGGGYAMVPVIQKEMVERAKLIKEKEFLDIIAVAQSLPGAVAVNTSVFVGFKLYGIPGALSALLGTVLPSMMVITVLAVFYQQVQDVESIELFFKGVRPAIVALIFMAAVKLAKNLDTTGFNILVGTAAFIAIVFFGIHPILVIIAAATIGLIREKKEEKHGAS